MREGFGGILGALPHLFDRSVTMTKKLWIDIETYCDLNLRQVGVYSYAAHNTFEILLVGWALDDGPVQIHQGPGLPETLVDLLYDPEVTKIAHNAQFERVCLSAALGGGTGWFLDPEQWADTMAWAAAAGLPQSLAKMTAAVGGETKTVGGSSLISMFSRKTRGKRILPTDRPAEWQAFKDYCYQDVVSMRDAASHLDPLSDTEQAVWVLDQRINDRGIQVDVNLATLARDADEANRVIAESRLRALMDIENPNSTQQLHRGFEALGVTLENLRAATVAEALQTATGTAREALGLRQQLALVAAKKYQAFLDNAGPDGRVRGSFRYHGAHTGRWSSRGIQLQNMPRAQLDNPEPVILDLLLGNGADSEDLKALVRSVLLGPFVVADYSAIEARALAWLAGEKWALEAFTEGRDIYVENASRMSTESHTYSRQDGKVAVLALGYQGGVMALRSMGATGTDDELREIVRRWRLANRNIRRFWAELEQAFRRGGKVGHVDIIKDGTTRSIILPSGRALNYHGVRLNNQIKFKNPLGGYSDTYGGRLSENITQAVSRDVLAQCLLDLEHYGYNVVGHVHDEVLVEAGPEHIPHVEDIMRGAARWAPGLPLDAEGFSTYRYRAG